MWVIYMSIKVSKEIRGKKPKITYSSSMFTASVQWERISHQKQPLQPEQHNAVVEELKHCMAHNMFIQQD